MRIPRAHREEDAEAILAVLRADGFPTLVTATQDGVVDASPLPVVLTSERDPLVVDVHMAKANPQWRTFDDREVLLVFKGPHDYVSPRTYAEPGAYVPTWNHVTVGVRGVPEILHDEAHWDVLTRTVDRFEAGRDEPWTVDESLAQARRLAPATVAFRLREPRVEAQFKLSQDKPEHVQVRVVEGFAQTNPDLAQQMTRARRRRAP